MSDTWSRKQPIAQPEGRVKFVDIGDRVQGRLTAVEEFNGLGQGWRLTFSDAKTRQQGEEASQATATLLATQRQLVGYLEREKPPLGTVLDIQLIGKKPSAAGFTSYDYSIKVVEGQAPAAPPAATQPALSDDLFG